MAGLVILCIGIMLVLTLLSVISGNDFLGSTWDYGVDIDALINGTTSDFVIEDQSAVFGIDPLQGAIVWIIVIVTIGVAVGIQVLGSGLSDRSVHLLFMGTFYISIWTILSILAMNLIIAIEIYGTVIYLTLTILYAIGSVMSIGGGNNGE
jgi:hypothetical protein